MPLATYLPGSSGPAGPKEGFGWASSSSTRGGKGSRFLVFGRQIRRSLVQLGWQGAGRANLANSAGRGLCRAPGQVRGLEAGGMPGMANPDVVDGGALVRRAASRGEEQVRRLQALFSPLPVVPRRYGAAYHAIHATTMCGLPAGPRCPTMCSRFFSPYELFVVGRLRAYPPPIAAKP